MCMDIVLIPVQNGNLHICVNMHNPEGIFTGAFTQGKYYIAHRNHKKMQNVCTTNICFIQKESNSVF